MATKKKKVIVTAPPIIEDISDSSLDELMGDRFGIYAKDVIQDRAIPDARDGLKPVQRRIVYDMWETHNTFEHPTKKSAHIVGDVMGKYHPHGDASIYDALAHLSQDWRLRYPLVQFQGNNGSMDGDDPAAPRYTEARLSRISNELVRDIETNTVDMALTYDDSETEPVVLPARFPNLFANGSSGIAVGLATEIPSHNLKEICQAISYRIKHRDCTVEDLMKFVPGPDFPTGGIIHGAEGLKSIYETGRGRISVSSRCEITEDEDGLKQIIVTEIPFGVNKAKLVGQIDKLRHDKAVAGIEEVRDETDKSGLRIAIDVKKEANPESLLKFLMSKTDLMTSYSANMVAIVDGRPKTLDLVSYADCYISHQIDVITRRSNFLLAKDKDRLSIVDGLIKAVSILEEVVEVIKKSKDKADSKKNICAAFGFNMEQAEAIVMMPLYKLSHTDIATLEAEKATLEKDIAYLSGLLNDVTLIEGVIIADLKAIVKQYGDERRTTISEEGLSDLSVDKRDLIAKEDCYVVFSRDGYVKRSSIKSFNGSGGRNGAEPGIKPGDVLVYKGLVTTKDYLLVFTEKGNYVYLPINEIKEAKWNDIGGHVSSLVQIEPGEKAVKAFALTKWRSDLYIVLLSKHGVIKRVPLSLFLTKRRSKALGAIRLSNTDTVVDVVLTTGQSDLFVCSQSGFASLYSENDIPLTNPRTGGVKAGSFKGSDMAGLVAFAPGEKSKLLLVTDKAHTRVVDPDKAVTKGGRLAKSVPLYSTFKSDPNKLIFIAKVGDREPPVTYAAILSNKEDYELTWNDFYLTPAEKYAKSQTGFKAKNKIALIGRADCDYIDEKIVSYEIPKPERPEEPLEPLLEVDVAKKADFEQISLFDEEDEDE